MLINRKYKLRMKLFVTIIAFLLFGCTEKPLVSKKTDNIKIYAISNVNSPTTEALINDYVNKDDIDLFLNLFNNSKKFKLILDTSIYNRMAILTDGDKVQKIFYVLYPNSFDGYFVFSGQNDTYQFTYSSLSKLISSGKAY